MGETGKVRRTLLEAPVQLRDVMLVEVHAQVHQEAAPTDVAPQVRMWARPLQVGEQTLHMQLRAEVTFETDPRPFELDVTISGTFEQVAPLPEGETLESYVSKTYFSLLLPFLREHVHELSVRLHLIPPIMLPLINTQPTSRRTPGAPTQSKSPSRRRPDRPGTTPDTPSDSPLPSPQGQEH